MLIRGGWVRIDNVTVLDHTGYELVVSAPAVAGGAVKLYVPHHRLEPRGPDMGAAILSPESPKGATGILMVQKAWAEPTGVVFS